MSASRLSAIVLALLLGVLAAGRSACLEQGFPTAAEKLREQPSLARARAATAGTNPAPKTPLGRLFRNSLYKSDVIKRGFSRDATEAAVPFALKLLSWRTLPPADRKPVSP